MERREKKRRKEWREGVRRGCRGVSIVKDTEVEVITIVA